MVKSSPDAEWSGFKCHPETGPFVRFLDDLTSNVLFELFEWLPDYQTILACYSDARVVKGMVDNLLTDSSKAELLLVCY